MFTSHKNCFRLIAGIAPVLAFLSPLAAHAGGGTVPAYSLTILAPLPGANDIVASGVNDSGEVVGTATSAEDTEHAFFYSNGTLKDLGTLPGAVNSAASGINASGQAVGAASYPSGSVQHAFLSGPNGGPLQDLGTLGGSFSLGFGVNTTGQVTGVSLTAAGDQHAFLTGPQGVGMTDLGALSGGGSQGNTVNAAGQVAGDSDLSMPSSFAPHKIHPFFYSEGGLSDLGTLGGDNGSASGINSEGQVVGDADIAGVQSIFTPFHAFLSAPDGGALQDLGTLGGTDSYGRAVNGAGQVVGGADTALEAEHAYLFANGKMVDLNSLITPDPGFTLTEATGISDTGYIVGYSTGPSGLREAFLLTPEAPVPEVSSIISLGLLLTVGLGGLAWSARRRNAHSTI